LALRRRRLANQVVSNRPSDLICSSLGDRDRAPQPLSPRNADRTTALVDPLEDLQVPVSLHPGGNSAYVSRPVESPIPLAPPRERREQERSGRGTRVAELPFVQPEKLQRGLKVPGQPLRRVHQLDSLPRQLLKPRRRYPYRVLHGLDVIKHRAGLGENQRHELGELSHGKRRALKLRDLDKPFGHVRQYIAKVSQVGVSLDNSIDDLGNILGNPLFIRCPPPFL